jgi:hypothetical protein
MTYAEQVQQVAKSVKHYGPRRAPRSATHRAQPLKVQGVLWCDVYDYLAERGWL